ncbi:hypothetical protein NM680_12990 [Paracoccus sp. PS-1]|uniref:hypothetical protein n=1 Tax=Paracoccus sp. PS1 TaxID=2963938 RepID=UPI0027E52428|nr:hypothetical protein [Paracoccus sp. PS1]MDQ7262708.1 hypothetical protein [Paracoccus sp. PS1]
MIEVELPDGTIAEFPDGTSRDVMKAALQRRFGGQPQDSSAQGGQERPEAPDQPQIVGGVIMPPPVPESGQWQETPQPSRAAQAIRAVREPINAVNRAFTNMFTLGSLDEIEGLADAAMTDQSFSEARQASRQRSEAQAAEYPIASTAAGIAGAVTSPAAQLAMRYFPAGGSPIAQIGAGAGTGAALGGVQGFMEGEGGAVNRLNNALGGMLFGGAIGGAIPAIAQGAGALYRTGRNALAEYRGIGQVADDLGISRRAGRLLSDTLEMDDAARMRNALNQAGPDAMLAEAGPTARNALDFVTQSPGEGARTALSRLDDRASAAGKRLTGALDDAMGAPEGLSAVQGAIRQGTAGARSAAYDAAYSKPIDYASEAGMQLEGLLRRVPGKAIQDANRLMQLDGDTSRQILASIADDGSVTFRQMPDVRQWDYIKRALDQAAASGEGQGALGGQTPMGRAYQGLARTIRDTVADAVPEYRTALDTAADAIGRIQGVEFGAGMLDAKVTREKVADFLQGATGAERAAIKQGVRQQIDDAVANVRAIATDPNMEAREAYKAYTMLTSRSSQDKMKMLLGDEWPAVKRSIDETASALGLRAGIGGNSKTAQRGELKQMIEDSLAPNAFRRGEPTTTAKGIWQQFTGAAPAQLQRARASVRNELADVLTRPNALATLNALEAARTAFPILPGAGRGVTNALNALGLGSVPAIVPEVRNRLRQP